MLSRLRARLTYANVTATLALFVALGGSSYAALKLPPNSVGSEQVKPGSLRASDFKGSLRESLRGPRGLTGATGAPGTVRAYATVSAESGQQPIFTAVARNLAFESIARTSAGYLVGTQLCTTASRCRRATRQASRSTTSTSTSGFPS
jgi:hypothetical protein